MRYLFIDKITELDPGRSIVTRKAISVTEDWTQDHFPGFPILPGALQIEAAAQAAGALLEISSDYRLTTLLIMVEKMKFKKPVHPGDLLEISARIVDKQTAFAASEIQIRCEGKLISTGKIVTGLRPIPAEKIADERPRLRKHYAFLLRDVDYLHPKNTEK